MTDQQHTTITPPPELMRQWREQAPRYRDGGVGREEWLMERSAQWGAGQELDACCKWLLGSAPWTVGPGERIEWVETLAMCRRPKPPSLKEQALMALEDGDTGPGASLTPTEVSVIRRALEALPDD